ncbi:MAG: EAL domain-containing protein [Acidimicrobiales bacterium]
MGPGPIEGAAAHAGGTVAGAPGTGTDADEGRWVDDAWLQLAIVALVVAYGLSLIWVARPASGYTTLWDGWVQNLALALPLAPVALAMVRQPERRLAWLMIGVGIFLNTVGNLVYLLHDQNQAPVPFPAPSDGPYIASYIGFILGVALLARTNDREDSTGASLDGLIAGLAIATLVAIAVLGPVLQFQGNALESAVGLAYPVLDLVLVAVIVTNLIVHRHNLDWTLIAVVVGVVCFVIGDTVYLEQVANGTYVAGTLLDETWVLGIFFIGLAASVRGPIERRGHPRRETTSTTDSYAVPMVFGTMAVAALVLALAGDPVPIQSGLVIALFLTVLVRTWITVRALHQAEAASSRDAHTDFLTGLSNRRDLLDRIEDLRADTTATAGEIGMILIDLDGFKEVNDSLGHMAGDELLRIVAARCQRLVGSSAIIARLGGDEYACAVRIDDDDDLRDLAERLQEVVSEPISLDGMTLRVDASIGLASTPAEDLDVVELLRQADVAMYEAKHERTGIRSYHADRDPNSRERLALVEALRGAIERRELILHKQPALDIRTGRARGVEALVRWERPGHGLVMPDDFVPLAERFGLIPKLTRAVIDQAVAELARLIERDQPIGMSVNISGSDLVDEDLPNFVVDTLRLHQVPPQLLTLEITESVLANDIDRAQRSIDRLRSDGIQISIDDYGVGYSSMSQLLSLHVDELKIDKSFVLALDSDERASAIVRSAVEFARALGLTVVAEGIETEGVMDRLHHLDVDVAQGFFVAHPLPSEALEAFLATSGVVIGRAPSIAPGPEVAPTAFPSSTPT